MFRRDNIHLCLQSIHRIIEILLSVCLAIRATFNVRIKRGGNQDRVHFERRADGNPNPEELLPVPCHSSAAKSTVERSYIGANRNLIFAMRNEKQTVAPLDPQPRHGIVQGMSLHLMSELNLIIPDKERDLLQAGPTATPLSPLFRSVLTEVELRFGIQGWQWSL